MWAVVSNRLAVSLALKRLDMQFPKYITLYSLTLIMILFPCLERPLLSTFPFAWWLADRQTLAPLSTIHVFFWGLLDRFLPMVISWTYLQVARASLDADFFLHT